MQPVPVKDGKLMSEIDNKGFFGQDFKKQYKIIRKKYKDYFSLIDEINQFCHLTHKSLNGKVHNNNIQEIVVSSLYVKAITSFQSIIILSKKGMHKDANIILRTLIELMFWLVSICKDKSLAKKYILKGEYEKIRMLKTLEKLESWHSDFGSIENIKNKKNELEQNYLKLLDEFGVEKKEIKEELHVSKIVEKAEVPEHFYMIYSYLCQDIHSNAISIEEYFSINELNNMEILYGPYSKYTGRVLLILMETMIRVLDSITELFNIRDEDKMQDFIDRSVLVKIKN